MGLGVFVKDCPFIHLIKYLLSSFCMEGIVLEME
jgi:hypothetical protein